MNALCRYRRTWGCSSGQRMLAGVGLAARGLHARGCDFARADADSRRLLLERGILELELHEVNLSWNSGDILLQLQNEGATVPGPGSRGFKNGRSRARATITTAKLSIKNMQRFVVWSLTSYEARDSNLPFSTLQWHVSGNSGRDGIERTNVLVALSDLRVEEARRSDGKHPVALFRRRFNDGLGNPNNALAQVHSPDRDLGSSLRLRRIFEANFHSLTCVCRHRSRVRQSHPLEALIPLLFDTRTVLIDTHMRNIANYYSLAPSKSCNVYLRRVVEFHIGLQADCGAVVILGPASRLFRSLEREIRPLHGEFAKARHRQRWTVVSLYSMLACT